MLLTSLLCVLVLCASCSCQTTSPSTSQTPLSAQSSDAQTVTVTSVSTLAIVILPSTATNSSNTATSLINSITPTPTPSASSPSTTFALQTTPYTGQAMLVGACAIAQYTALPFPDGSQVEVPLVGCSDDRPECCPSLDLPNGSSAQTTLNVVSLLNEAPLTICPSDFVDLDPVCCPSGFSLYGQSIIGQTPCYSMMSTTVPVPQGVLASISSAVAASISSADATSTVSVIVNQVFALGLLCADNGNVHEGLSTGAKAGVGVGSGIGGLLLLAIAVRFFFFLRKNLHRNRAARNAPQMGTPYNNDAPPPKIDPYQARPYSPRATSELEDPASVHIGPYPPSYQGSPPMRSTHDSWQQQPYASPEHRSLGSEGDATYQVSLPRSPQEMPAYQTQTLSHQQSVQERLE